MNFCILIPVYNTAKAIGPLIEQIKNHTHNIIIINDGSQDDTASIAGRLGAVVISHSQNRGKGASLKTGFDYILKNTGFEYIIIMDGDGQHSPKFIEHFLCEAQKTDADIIAGNRMEDVADMPIIRRLTNRTMSFIISGLTGQKIPDTQCGYRLLRRRVLEQVKLETSRYDTESEILFKAARKNFKITSIKISTIYHQQESGIKPAVDSLRFIRLLARLLILKR